ncbi:MAG: sterol desaturase family protein [Rhodobacteraceae bacterium]|nr:sterol desaturase family protein [Paracoccaceae bacterium]
MENESLIRLSIFLGLFVLFALIEAWIPRRTRVQTRTKRWFTNWGLSILNTGTISLMAMLLPFLAVGAAFDAASNGWGLFNQLSWPTWLEFVLAILILDWAIWFQHLITHKIPFLWRFHRVHHSDRDLDVTSAFRFHPVEIALSMVLKIGAVYLLGPAGLAVVVFEIILNGSAMFNHANIYLSKRVDRWLRLVIVTPDMHRVHHSDKRSEHDSNYGFSISLWDRLFRTYIAQPEDSHSGMTVGLRWQDDKPSNLVWTLKLPIDKL